MESGLSYSCRVALNYLFTTWFNGSYSFETVDSKLPRSSQWHNPLPRRFRLLEARGYAEQVQAIQGNRWVAYRITARGIAAFDLMILRQEVVPYKEGSWSY